MVGLGDAAETCLAVIKLCACCTIMLDRMHNKYARVGLWTFSQNWFTWVFFLNATLARWHAVGVHETMDVECIFKLLN